MTDIPPLALPLPDGLTPHETLIVEWIGSDPPLLEQMRLLLADDEPYNPIPYDFTQLSSVIFDMLYNPLYGYYPKESYGVRDLLGVTQHGGDDRKAAALRVHVTKRDLYGIEEDGWARIRTALLAGTENDA